MKKTYIENMPAGIELDTLIAEKVMGEIKPTYAHDHYDIFKIIYSEKKNWCCYPEFDKGDICEWKPKPFSSSILSAWEVVDKLSENGWYFQISTSRHAFTSFEIFIRDSNNGTWSRDTGEEDGYIGEGAYADTVPLAICRAALLATEHLE